MRTILLSTLLLSAALASALQTLNSVEDLKNTGFDDPPHYGLRLLQWYVQNCLNNNWKSLCDPVAGEYGFHQFHNNEVLLPKLPTNATNIGYFTIGNLKKPKAKDLPKDVKKDYNRTNPLTNRDRVLVKYNKNNKRISDIFISEHYEEEGTYIISRKLVNILRKPTPRFYIEM